MLRAGLLTFVFIFFLPLAQADAGLSLTDPALDAMPLPGGAWGDIVGAKLARTDERTLRATLGRSVLPEPQVGSAYVVVFGDGTDEWFAALSVTPQSAYFVGAWNDQDPEDVQKTTGTDQVGAPGRITLDVPVSVIPENVTELVVLRALVLDLKGALADGPIVVIDTAEGMGALRVREAEDAPVSSTPAEPAASAETPTPQEHSVVPSSTVKNTPIPGLWSVVALFVVAAALAPRRSRS